MPSDASRARLLCLIVSAMATALRAETPATAPTSAPAESAAAADRRGKFLIEQRARLAEMLAQSPRQSPRRAGEVFHLSIVDGHLAAEAGADLPDEAIVPLDQGRGVVVFRRNRLNAAADAPAALNVEYLRLHGDDATAPAATSIQLLSVPGDRVLFTLNEQTPDATTDAQIIDISRDNSDAEGDPPSSKLLFTRRTEIDEGEPGANDERDGKVEHVAPTFAALLAAHHDDVVSAMLEAFTSLRSMHVLSGLSEAQLRQVLATDAPADAKNARAVLAILAMLDGDDAAADAAARKLLAGDGGMSTAIALAAADRRGWSPDRAMKVDALLADVLPLSQRQARRALTSPTRLVDALYWPDATLRRAIKSRLATIVGAPRVADIDADADPYGQTGKIEALRASLLHAAR